MSIRPIFIASLLIIQLGVLCCNCNAANNSRPAASAAQSYGEISDTVQKIEDMLNNGAQNLSETEYQDYRSRLERLKADARIDISGGANASALYSPAKSLHEDLALRLRENANHASSDKKQIEAEISKIETLFKERSENLSTEEQAGLRNSIEELKTRVSGKLQIEGGAASLMHDAHQLHMEIVSKSWTKLGSRNKDTRKDASLGFGRDSERQMLNSEPPTPEVHRGRIEESAASLMPTVPVVAPHTVLPRKPLISIPKQMQLVETELIEAHERGRLGTFDMDLFTSKLLAIKKNWNVMIQKAGVLSRRQEGILRQELEHLHQNISDRLNN